MGLPQLESCCFSFDLKTGCVILGILSATFSFILFVVMIVSAVELSYMTNETWLLVMFDKDTDTVNLSARITGLYVMSIILVFMFLAKFLFDLFLVYGVVMERAKFMKAYFIMWVVFTLLSMFVFFLNSYYYGKGTIVTEVSSLVINVYLILVSRSFYVNLTSQEVV